jgi:cobalt-zinc-cadmium efflux system outer membrane protein
MLAMAQPPVRRAEPVTADTSSLSLPAAEDRFLKSNAQLLASRFGIDAAKAAIIQAQLWSNPNISIEQNVYNQLTKRYFDFTATGNTEIALQQLIMLAGKRGKQIRLAEINTEIAENTYYDLLRSLKLELRTDYYDLFFLQQSLAFYEESIPSVQRTVAAAEKMFDNRGMLLSELLRLKSLLLSLESDRLDISNKISDIQADLHVLLRDSVDVQRYYRPEVLLQKLDTINVKAFSLDAGIASAFQHRPDYKNALATVRLDETNLTLQRAMRIPDVTVGGRWSRQGSYIPDYFALSVSVDLPFFNGNQGNIEAAEYTYRADAAAREAVVGKVEREVTNAYNHALQSDNLYKKFDRKFTAQYRTLVDGMIASYEQRNISIIVFTDFYESYRTSMLQINKLQNDRIDAIEGLNYAVGTSVFDETR